MKPLSKVAILLSFAGVMAVLFAMVAPGHRAMPAALQARLTKSVAFLDQVTQNMPVFAKATVATQIPVESQTNSTNVKIPAIRGESNYGWVQLPRGTTVDLVRQTADDSLIVRWDGVMVKVPQTAALSGAIALRQSANASLKN